MRLTPRKLVQWVIVAAFVLFIVSFFQKNTITSDGVRHFSAKSNGLSNSDLLIQPQLADHPINQLHHDRNSLFVGDGNILDNDLGVHKTDNRLSNVQSFGHDVTENELKHGQVRMTVLNDIFISLKTTHKFHKTRLKLLLDTWIAFAKAQTYIFTDSYDAELYKLTGGRLINTSCPMEHNRQALCCKMSVEYDFFMESNKRWFCHVDDDTYVNTDALVSFLQLYSHTEDWYLGRPSMSHPIEVMTRDNPELKVAFWFATGGAGFCISRSLALKMMPHASGGRLITIGDKIRLPDDCTVGYIIEHLLQKRLTVTDKFHSHLEALVLLKPNNLKHGITFSYSNYSGKWNRLRVPPPVFPLKDDPTRLRSLHCYLHPSLKHCTRLMRYSIER